VWIEFMQRVWMMKMRKRMEEQAELWRRQRHQKPATATAAAAK
jgi:hypothetical protein